MRSWGWCPCDGISALLKGDPGATAHTLLPRPGESTVGGQPSASPEEGAPQESDHADLLVWIWASSLQNWKINVRCLSQPSGPGAFFEGRSPVIDSISWMNSYIQVLYYWFNFGTCNIWGSRKRLHTRADLWIFLVLVPHAALAPSQFHCGREAEPRVPEHSLASGRCYPSPFSHGNLFFNCSI